MNFEDVVVDLLQFAATELPIDVSAMLKKALKTEGNPAVKTQLKAIVKNFELALEESTVTSNLEKLGHVRTHDANFSRLMESRNGGSHPVAYSNWG
ncbi:MAG: fumarate hydratase [Candidatus Heimdallarchaeota archaeon]